MKKMNKKGFTIVELVIVIAVIAILAAVMIPTFSNVITKAKYNAAVQEARSLYTAYLASTAETGTTDKDFFIKVDEGQYIKVVNGELQIDPDCKFVEFTAATATVDATDDLVEADSSSTNAWGVKYTVKTKTGTTTEPTT